jgi:hypothetical protein
VLNIVFQGFSLTLLGLIQLIQPILVPLCFVIAWGLIGLGVWSVWSAIRDGVSKAKQMHRIPCANCQYFTGDYHLKCPVHPTEALSEDAIGCPDFDPQTKYGTFNHVRSVR